MSQDHKNVQEAQSMIEIMSRLIAKQQSGKKLYPEEVKLFKLYEKQLDDWGFAAKFSIQEKE